VKESEQMNRVFAKISSALPSMTAKIVVQAMGIITGKALAQYDLRMWMILALISGFESRIPTLPFPSCNLLEDIQAEAFPCRINTLLNCVFFKLGKETVETWIMVDGIHRSGGFEVITANNVLNPHKEEGVKVIGLLCISILNGATACPISRDSPFLGVGPQNIGDIVTVDLGNQFLVLLCYVHLLDPFTPLIVFCLIFSIPTVPRPLCFLSILIVLGTNPILCQPFLMFCSH
jgi:hypothetical protein